MPTTLQAGTRRRPKARPLGELISIERSRVLCGCGRAIRLRRHQAAAPLLAFTTIPILVAVIATARPPAVIAVISLAATTAVSYHLRVAFLIAEITGTGFCAACTRRA